MERADLGEEETELRGDPAAARVGERRLGGLDVEGRQELVAVLVEGLVVVGLGGREPFVGELRPRPGRLDGEEGDVDVLSQAIHDDHFILAYVDPAYEVRWCNSKEALLQLIQSVLPMITINSSSYEANKTLVAGNMAVADGIWSLDITDLGDFIWRICMTDAVQGKGLADYSVGTLGLQKVAIMYDNSDYGRGLADAYDEGVKAAGGVRTFEDAEQMIKAGATRCTIEAGMTKPMPAFEPLPDSMAKVTPITWPWSLTSTPPELPGLMGASVWMMSGME